MLLFNYVWHTQNLKAVWQRGYFIFMLWFRSCDSQAWFKLLYIYYCILTGNILFLCSLHPLKAYDGGHIIDKYMASLKSNVAYFKEFFIFFAYKRHVFFLFRKYILQVLVISGTGSWKQHIQTIFRVDILFYKLFTCICRENVFRSPAIIQQHGETLKSFIPSHSWAY